MLIHVSLAGNWPTVQNIKRIKRITVYHSSDSVVGLKVLYQLVEGVEPNPTEVAHGLVTGTQFTEQVVELQG